MQDSVDIYGLPLGPVREQLWENILTNTAAELNREGWDAAGQVYSITVAGVDNDGEDVLARVSVAQVGSASGDVASALWGQTAPDDVAGVLVAVEGWADDGVGEVSEVRMLFLTTRTGDSAQLHHFRENGVDVFHGHGEGADVAVVKVMARMLGLPVFVDKMWLPRHLVGTWLAHHSLDVLVAQYADGSGPKDSEGWYVRALQVATTAAAQAVGDFDQHPPVTVSGSRGEIVKTLDSLSSAAEQISQLGWSEMLRTPFAELLPDELSDDEQMVWAGEDLAGWWTFNKHTTSSQGAFVQLRALDPGCERGVQEVLSRLGWSDPDMRR